MEKGAILNFKNKLFFKIIIANLILTIGISVFISWESIHKKYLIWNLKVCESEDCAPYLKNIENLGITEAIPMIIDILSTKLEEENRDWYIGEKILFRRNEPKYESRLDIYVPWVFSLESAKYYNLKHGFGPDLQEIKKNANRFKPKLYIHVLRSLFEHFPEKTRKLLDTYLESGTDSQKAISICVLFNTARDSKKYFPTKSLANFQLGALAGIFVWGEELI